MEVNSAEVSAASVKSLGLVRRWTLDVDIMAHTSGMFGLMFKGTVRDSLAADCWSKGVPISSILLIPSVGAIDTLVSSSSWCKSKGDEVRVVVDLVSVGCA